MRIKWTDIISYSTLKNAKVIAGINGLNRQVKRISVYDRIKPEDFDADEDGMLYISSFQQFLDCNDKILHWIKDLDENGASGIITLSEGLELLPEEVIVYCNNNGFPIVSVDRDITYAEIIENVSILLYFNKLHLMKEEKIKHILYNKLSQREKLDELKNINPNVKECIMVWAVEGEIVSDIYERELNKLFDNSKENTYIPLDDIHLFILSDEKELGLERKAQSMKNILSPCFSKARIGEGKKYRQIDIDKAIENAIAALEIAKLKEKDFEKYDDFSDIALLITTKSSEEFTAFYDKFMQLISSNDPAGKMEYLQCIREYVMSKGEYAVVAQNMYQHENTIRYRINKVKSMLGLEDDTIKFNEIISLFVAIDQIINE